MAIRDEVPRGSGDKALPSSSAGVDVVNAPPFAAFVPPVRRLASESLIGAAGLSIGDFWSWAYSDLLSNRNRGIFAEFLVATALGIADTPRVEWNDVDLRYAGRAVEVKSAAYLQAWAQKAPSKIIFDVGEKLGWNAETNTSRKTAVRSSDCYVFCLFADRDRNFANVIDADRWLFYVAATNRLNEALRKQKTASLRRIEALSRSCRFGELRHVVDDVLCIVQQAETA